MNDLPERNQDEQKEEKDITGHFSLFGGATCEQSLWKKQLFALISNAIHPHATHIFTLFLATLKRNKCLSSIPCYLGIPSFSSIPSYLPFPPLSPSPYQSDVCVSVCVWLQLWAFFAALSLSTVEMICSRGLSYNAHIKKFLQDAACARALVLYGSKSAGEFLHCAALTYHFPHPSHTLCPLNLCT